MNNLWKWIVGQLLGSSAGAKLQQSLYAKVREIVAVNPSFSLANVTMVINADIVELIDSMEGNNWVLRGVLSSALTGIVDAGIASAYAAAQIPTATVAN